MYGVGRTQDIGTLPGPPGAFNAYEEAFILNNYHSDVISDPEYNDPCWREVQTYLAAGITSETCVQYYYSDGQVPGFDIRFIECGPW